MTPEHVDVLIVGAGISGIAAAYYIQQIFTAQRHLNLRTYAIIEARDAIGGTWDLFHYPGIRSDSDMHTLGYAFYPWQNPKAIADGPAICAYVRETAAHFSIDRHIHFHHRLRRAAWDSDKARWEVIVEVGPAATPTIITCGFLYMCTGYYDYDQGYTPQWPGVEQFQGTIIHPQQWPEQLDYTGKRVVVIGSGATAVTIVPAMADQAAHVTMLQRSPTYIVSRPSEDRSAKWLQSHFPASIAHGLTRWKNILSGMYTYALARSRPALVRTAIVKMVRTELGPTYDVAKDFSPTYNPWDQRVCLVPDSDLFQAMKAGKASVVTDQIETFTATGLRLVSGKELPADIIITATGLTMRLMSGVELTVDGRHVDLGTSLTYKGLMISDVPNLAASFGYTNASWTLKCELIARYVARLLRYMDRHGYDVCLPARPAGVVGTRPAIDFTSGYVQRAVATLPRQGQKRPWRTYQNYVRDLFMMRYNRVSDGTLRFMRRQNYQSSTIR